jgi:hypothetical protein
MRLEEALGLNDDVLRDVYYQATHIPWRRAGQWRSIDRRSACISRARHARRRRLLAASRLLR